MTTHNDDIVTGHALHFAALHPLLPYGLKYRAIIALVRYMHATCSAGGISEIQPIMCSRAGIVDSGPRAQREAFAQVSMTDSILQWI